MKHSKNRLALNLFRPLELGVIKDTPEDREYIAHFITHLIGLSDPEDYDRVVAVIGAPAEASHVDKTAIFDAAAGSGQLRHDHLRTVRCGLCPRHDYPHVGH